MDWLNLRIPPYIRIDLFQIIVTQSLSSGVFFWVCNPSINYSVQVYWEVHIHACSTCLANAFYSSFMVHTKYREHNVTNQSIDLIVFLGLSMGTFLFLLDLVIELLLWLTSFRKSCTMSLVKRADQLSWVLYDVPCRTSCLWLSWLSYHLQNDVYLFHWNVWVSVP